MFKRRRRTIGFSRRFKAHRGFRHSARSHAARRIRRYGVSRGGIRL